MSRQLKQLVTDTLKTRFDGVDQALVVDITRLNVQDTQKVRTTLAEQNIRVMVVPNSLARRAFTGGPLELLGQGLSGPCAVVCGGDSLIDVAREVAKLAGMFPLLELKQGLLPGDDELTAVSDLAKMKGRAELLGEIAMLMSSPGRSIAGCIAGPQSRVAGCVKTISERE